MKTDLSFLKKLLEQKGYQVELEFQFAKELGRLWRFDLAVGYHKLALEVNGGIFIAGRHSRGAAMLKEWDKLNCAAAMGWRVIYCQPCDVKTGRAYTLVLNVMEGNLESWRKIK